MKDSLEDGEVLGEIFGDRADTLQDAIEAAIYIALKLIKSGQPVVKDIKFLAGIYDAQDAILKSLNLHRQVINSFFFGMREAGVNAELGEVEFLPLFLKPHLTALLKSAILEDENRPKSEREIWRNAVNSVTHRLYYYGFRMTHMCESPCGGVMRCDATNKLFFDAIENMEITLPSSEELEAADAAHTAARASRKLAEVKACEERADWEAEQRKLPDDDEVFPTHGFYGY